MRNEIKKNLSNKNIQIPQLLTAHEAAIALRIHRSQITRLVANGALQAVRVGTRLMIEKAVLADYIRAAKT